MSLFATIAHLESIGADAAVCTVVKISGSTPRKASAKMIVVDNHEPFGSIIGTIGGGAIEHLIRTKAMESIRLNQPLLITTSLRNELGMCCGGEMTIYIEPIEKKPKFICFGAGHIAQALCPLAINLGYEVSLVDERTTLLNHEAFSQVSYKFSDSQKFSLNNIPFTPNTYVVIATFDHALDQQIVENIINRPFRYGALVGSVRKALMTKKRLLAKGFNEQVIKRINCPAGLNINAKTPQEIALSIAAQMTMVKNEENKSVCHDSGSRGQQALGF